VSFVLIVWLLSRVNSRYELSLLSFEGMSEISPFIWSSYIPVVSLYRTTSVV
jgi:hypothetical protein